MRGCCGEVGSGRGVLAVVCVRVWAVVVMRVVADAGLVCIGVILSRWEGLVGGVLE